MKRYHLVTKGRMLGRQSCIGFNRVGFEGDGKTEFECWSEIDANDKRFPRYLIRVPQQDLVFHQGQAELFRLRRGPRLLFTGETLLTRNVEVPLQQEQQNFGWTRIAVRRFFAFHVRTCRPSTLMIFSEDDDWTWIAIAIAYFKWTRFAD